MLLALTLILAAPSPDRVVHAARLWGEVRYFHPWLYTREVDWDAAFIRALPAILGEGSERAALQAMLDEMHDPATRMVEEVRSSPKASSTMQWLENGVLAVKLEQLGSGNDLRTDVARLQPEIAKARALILDARGQPPVWMGVEDVGDELGELLPLVVPRPLLMPAERVVLHSGYRPQVGTTSSGYISGLLTLLPVEVPAAKTVPERVALLIDSTTPLPALGLSLQRAGAAAIIAEGPIDDRFMVHARYLDLGPGLKAEVRAGELDAPVAADVTAPPGEGMKAALSWIKSSAAPRAATAAPLAPAGAWRPDKTYSDMQAPSLEYRLLALVRFWNVIEHFYPYKRLLDRPWEETLREFIPRFEAADSADAYARAVMEMSAQIQDSHVGVRGPPAVMAIRGEAGLGLRVQILDGAPVIVEVLRGDAPDVHAGDVIEEIDGEPLVARAARLEKYAAASLALGRRMRAIGFALAGPAGSTAALRLSGGKTVKLERKAVYPPQERPAFRALEDNVGYADLTRLQTALVDAMFEQFASTRALILDMRGYPKGTAWAIAPRINVKAATHAAWFARNLLSGEVPGEEEHASMTFQQKIPISDKPVYRGRVVMLIDEFAISQSEHSGLFFEAVTNITYVGSPTAGANGDVTLLTLPGGVTVSFTGHDVRHADGRQLQRIGLQPDVPVRPTLKGIRAGRDEVLERAVRLLAEKPDRRAMPAKITR